VGVALSICTDAPYRASEGCLGRRGTVKSRTPGSAAGVVAQRKGRIQAGFAVRDAFHTARDPSAIHKRAPNVDSETVARCVVVLQVAAEIIEDTNEVAIKIGGHKFAQLPRFVLRPGNNLRLRGLPLREEFVDFGLAIEIEPEKDGARVPVGLSEGAIGEKQSAIPPGDACNAALVVSPIEGEAKRVDVVGCGFVDVSRGDLRDRCGERHRVVGGILAQDGTKG